MCVQKLRADQFGQCLLPFVHQSCLPICYLKTRKLNYTELYCIRYLLWVRKLVSSIKGRSQATVFDNRVLRNIFGLKREGVTGGWLQSRNEQFHGLWSLSNVFKQSGISGACGSYGREEKYIGESCALLRYYTASRDNSLPTFRDKLSVPSKKDSWALKMGPIGFPETSVRNYHYFLHNSSEKRRSHLRRAGNLKSYIEIVCGEIWRTDTSWKI